MRRDSARTLGLVKQLEGITLRGRPITGIMLEELDRDRLLLEDDDDRFVECLKALDALDYGQGKSAAETALRLLARGFGVQRVKRELIAFGEQLGESVMRLGEMGSGELDAIADEWVGKPNAAEVASPMARIDAAVADVPNGGREDYAGLEIRETPDDRARGVNRAAVRILANQLPQNIDLLIDVTRSPVGIFGPDPKHHQRVALPNEIDDAGHSLDSLRSSLHDYPTLVRSASLEVLEANATRWMTLFGVVPLPSFSQREREIQAARISPITPPLTGW